MKRKAAALITVLLITLLLIISFLFVKAIIETPWRQWSISSTRVPTYIITGSVASAYDRGYAVVQTTDGGYAIGGLWNDHGWKPHSGGVSNYTGVIIKTDAAGRVKWEKTLNKGRTGIYPEAIIQTSDSGFLVNCGIEVFKLDAEGNIQWSKWFENLYIESVIQAGDGSYVFVGWGDNNRNSVLFKTDDEGNQVWNETVGFESKYTFLRVVTKASDGGYVAAGTWDYSLLLIKTSVNGTIQLTRTYDFGIEKGQVMPPTNVALCKTKDGGYILAGGLRYDNHYYPWIYKLDSEGNLQWNQTYDDGGRFVSVVQIANGDYVAAGEYFLVEDDGALMVKTDEFGKIEWNAKYWEKGTYHDNEASSVIATADGGFAVVGTLDDSIWLAKFAPESAVSELLSFIAVWVTVTVGVGLLVYFKKRKQ